MQRKGHMFCLCMDMVLEHWFPAKPQELGDLGSWQKDNFTVNRKIFWNNINTVDVSMQICSSSTLTCGVYLCEGSVLFYMCVCVHVQACVSMCAHV